MNLKLLIGGCCMLIGAACSSPKPSEQPERVSPETLTFYIGTASGADSVGIYQASLDEASGGLSLVGNLPGILNPGFIALSPDGKHLYAVHSVPGQKESGVSAFSRDLQSGALRLLNTQSSMGRGACYVSASQDGQRIYVANYGSGAVSSYPRLPDGTIGEAASTIQHEGSSVNPERQEGPHAHYIHEGVGNRIFAADLGTDQVFMYEPVGKGGAIQSATPPYLSMDPGVGPRHVDYHPSGKYVYVMNELTGSVTVFSYEEGSQAFEKIETVSSLPEGFEGYNKSADIHVHPTGKFLYASNRGDLNSIAIFSINPANGRIQLENVHDPGIAWPRNFAIAPSGDYLLVANRDEDAIRSFKIDLETGLLEDTGATITVPRPICIKFVP